jgi:hypothetical protein
MIIVFDGSQRIPTENEWAFSEQIDRSVFFQGEIPVSCEKPLYTGINSVIRG